MSLLFFLHRPLDLDKPVDKVALTAIEPLRPECFLRFYLQEVLTEGALALALFVHEEQQCMRSCCWIPRDGIGGAWYEQIGLPFDSGLRLIRLILARSRSKRQKRGFMTGSLWCRWQGALHEFAVQSPHHWEVRIFVGSERPSKLAYTVIPTGRIGPGEGAAARSSEQGTPGGVSNGAG